MAPGTIIDVDSSIERQIIDPQHLTPDDIFEAALAASQHDSDGEDPFEDPPKRFMQTEHQKKRQRREIKIRRLAWRLRNMRKGPERIKRLPPELILNLMCHTHVQDLCNLANSGPNNRSIFKAYGRAIFRGMEVEQFGGWKWLFGDTIHRTSEQSQHLKDAISVEYQTAATGSAFEEEMLALMKMVDDRKFTGMRNVRFLQRMQNCLDDDMEAIGSYTKRTITRRAAICLRSLSFQRIKIVEEQGQIESGKLIEFLPLTWEARSQTICEQPASTQAEIRLILEAVVTNIYLRFERVLVQWAWGYYSGPGNHIQPREMKRWMSMFVTGLILEEVIPQWYSDDLDSSLVLCFTKESSIRDLIRKLRLLLRLHDAGAGDIFETVKAGREFGNGIGMDLKGLLEGTRAGNHVDQFGLIVETTEN